MNQTKYDVFISYSRKDYVDEQKNVIPGNEVSKIKEALSVAGISYWFDEEGIYSGQNFVDKIVTNIENAKIFLFLSTVNSNKSPWTCKEIASADEFKKHIIPVRIDSAPYNKKVLFRIADLDYIEYYTNPQKGVEDMIKSIKAYLEELAATEKHKIDEENKKKELERQRIQQEENKRHQELIAKIETEIAALESQKIERKKVILQKEQELKLAQIDFEDCESRIKKLQTKFEELRNPDKERKQEDERKHLDEEERAKEMTFNVGDVQFKMIRVEGGPFMMGSPDNDSDAFDDENPQHRVTLNDYYIGETQVTQALWKAVMGDNPSYWKGDSLPVENVSWDDCQKFIKQLNNKTDKTFRLPTEAEWEYAARGGRMDHGYKYAGGNYIEKVAWYDGNSESKTHPVKQKDGNELGLYDMSGNVWEWCQDWYGNYNSSAQTNPLGPSSGSFRVLRGGSWYDFAGYCRTARRYDSPNSRYYSNGFRLALVQQ
jgi:formylglycine-generating enzyme required for sulfatase activity